MRDKYIEEEFPRYFVFGVSPETGLVDLTTINRDIATDLKPDDADRIIADRDVLLDKLIATALAFNDAAPEAFSKFWYGS